MMLSGQEIISASPGEYFIHTMMDEITGYRTKVRKMDKEEAAELVMGSHIHSFTQDDGVGMLVFYRSNPNHVHTLLMACE